MTSRFSIARSDPGGSSVLYRSRPNFWNRSSNESGRGANAGFFGRISNSDPVSSISNGGRLITGIFSGRSGSGSLSPA